MRSVQEFDELLKNWKKKYKNSKLTYNKTEKTFSLQVCVYFYSTLQGGDMKLSVNFNPA